MSQFLNQYKTFKAWPLGGFAFNKAIGFLAPFFSTIKPKILVLKPAYCSVEMRDRRAIRNHIGSINAGALCTLAELTGGMAVDAAMPGHLRWIPKSMCVNYQMKARGTLTAICSFDASLVGAGEVVIPVSVQNADEQEVFKAEITFHISERK